MKIVTDHTAHNSKKDSNYFGPLDSELDISQEFEQALSSYSKNLAKSAHNSKMANFETNIEQAKLVNLTQVKSPERALHKASSHVSDWSEQTTNNSETSDDVSREIMQDNQLSNEEAQVSDQQDSDHAKLEEQDAEAISVAAVAKTLQTKDSQNKSEPNEVKSLNLDPEAELASTNVLKQAIEGETEKLAALDQEIPVTELANLQSQVEASTKQGTATLSAQEQSQTLQDPLVSKQILATNEEATVQTTSEVVVEKLDQNPESNLAQSAELNEEGQEKNDQNITNQSAATLENSSFAASSVASSQAGAIVAQPQQQKAVEQLDSAVKASTETKLAVNGISSLKPQQTLSDASAARLNLGNSLKSEEKQLAQQIKSTYNKLQLNSAIEKVESALKEVARSKDGKTISLRLDPPSLGSVKIDLSLRDSGLHARVVAESPTVASVLREKSHELQQLLRGVVSNLEEVRISIGERGTSFEGSEFTNSNSGKQQNNSKDSELQQNAANMELFSMDGTVKSDLIQTSASSQAVVLDHWVA